MYDWRRMTPEQRKQALVRRVLKQHPWHSPPHRILPGMRQYIVTAACFEHAPVIGTSLDRLDEFANELLGICTQYAERTFAWVVLPNHYHVVLQTDQIKPLLKDIGLLHGRKSYEWNGQDNGRGRQVWCNCVEREMRSDGHLWASINYVHHNPVKHGYVDEWVNWAWSSASSFLDDVGRDEAVRIWQAYPVKNYGAGWDD